MRLYIYIYIYRQIHYRNLELDPKNLKTGIQV